jgi:hypothetical protein
MEETPRFYPIAAEEDPEVHRYLVTLERYAPHPSLADRVLVRVRRPDPRWLRDVRDRAAALVASGRIWYVVAAFAIGSLIPQIALVALGTAYADVLSQYAGLMTAQFLPRLLEAALSAITGARFIITSRLGVALPLGLTLWEAAAIAAALTLAAAYGLHRTLAGWNGRRVRP